MFLIFFKDFALTASSGEEFFCFVYYLNLALRNLWTTLVKKLFENSHEIINELLEMIASKIIRVITAKIKKATYFSIMLDEISDISILEQVLLCV